MRNPLRYLSLALVVLGIAVGVVTTVHACGGGGGGSGWAKGPGISDAAIKKEFDVQWFHINNEPCYLRAKGVDIDTANGNPYGSWIKLDLTTWEGYGLEFFRGEVVTYRPSEPTGSGGTTITATIKDNPVLPDGTNTDDPDVQATKTMYAYMAVGHLSYTSAISGSGDLDSTEVDEQVTFPHGKNMSLETTTGEIGSGLWEINPGFTVTTPPAFGTATWSLNTVPPEASLSGGLLYMDILGQAFGEWEATTGGIGGGPPLFPNINVSLSASGGTSASVTVSITEDPEDDVEASAALGFAFSSDIMGDDSMDEIKDTTSQDLGPYADNFAYNPPVVRFFANKGGVTRAKAVVQGKAQIVDRSRFGSTSAVARTLELSKAVFSIYGRPSYKATDQYGNLWLWNYPPEEGYGD